jgi:hypothetical protein
MPQAYPYLLQVVRGRLQVLAILRILLDHPRHLLHGFIHLTCHEVLSGRRFVDAAASCLGPLHGDGDGREYSACLPSEFDTLRGKQLTALQAIGCFEGQLAQPPYHRLNLTRGVSGATRQGSNFVSHYSETSPMVASSCGLNGGIKG